MAPGSCKFGGQRLPQHSLPWATSQECLWYSQCMQPLPAASCSTESFSSTSFGTPYQQSCGQQPPKFHPPSVGFSRRAPRETSPTESFPAGGFPASREMVSLRGAVQAPHRASVQHSLPVRHTAMPGPGSSRGVGPLHIHLARRHCPVLRDPRLDWSWTLAQPLLCPPVSHSCALSDQAWTSGPGGASSLMRYRSLKVRGCLLPMVPIFFGVPHFG